MRMPLLAGLSLLLLSAAVAAAPATVSAVNMPAWLERASQARPLLPGQVLQSGDLLRTGQGGRVLLSLPEGSQIKLGEAAVFRVDKLNAEDGRRSPFTTAVDVLKGAFRFTTALVAKARQREIDVRVATITAGIRGTDLWGKADEERDLVCLLEGRIAVSHEGDGGFQEMNEPLSFFVAPKGKPALPLAKVEAEKVDKEWAPQTELQAGRGVSRTDGKWRLVVASAADQDETLRWYDSLRAAGYAAKVKPIGTHAYRVSLEQLASEADAQALGEQLKATLGTPLSQVLPMAK
ncbi:FecR domain-containing protein [Chitinimonas sp.]|uniref:FecR domain-containing protein n=1 Tax=Chitinimonas sp. TaxID=1934313 RepID=UPI002F94DD55